MNGSRRIHAEEPPLDTSPPPAIQSSCTIISDQSTVILDATTFPLSSSLTLIMLSCIPDQSMVDDTGMSARSYVK